MRSKGKSSILQTVFGAPLLSLALIALTRRTTYFIGTRAYAVRPLHFCFRAGPWRRFVKHRVLKLFWYRKKSSVKWKIRGMSSWIIYWERKVTLYEWWKASPIHQKCWSSIFGIKLVLVIICFTWFQKQIKKVAWDPRARNKINFSQKKWHRNCSCEDRWTFQHTKCKE